MSTLTGLSHRPFGLVLRILLSHEAHIPKDGMQVLKKKTTRSAYSVGVADRAKCSTRHLATRAADEPVSRHLGTPGRAEAPECQSG